MLFRHSFTRRIKNFENIYSFHTKDNEQEWHERVAISDCKEKQISFDMV